MASKVSVLNIALKEFEKAAQWYAEISPELSLDLVKKFEMALVEAGGNPLKFQLLKGGFRKINIDRFPYKIIYKIFPDEILVVAFAHHKRRSFYWKNR
jgi:toxin ParE1/3/4